MIDFSGTANPLGPPPGAIAAAAAVDISAPADPDCSALVVALAERHRVPPEQILAGNGATQLIHLVTRVFVHASQRPIVLAPTIQTYATAAALVGATVYPWPAQAARGFRWNLKNKPDVLRRVAAPLVYVCNPNNPTGVYLQRHEVEGLAAALTGGPMLLDETYADFVEDAWPAAELAQTGRVAIVRSMTAAYALAGVRLGYLVAHADLVQAVKRLQPRRSVNAVAQAAALASLHDGDYLRRTRAFLVEARRALAHGLEALGLTVHHGAANFMLVDVGDGACVRAQLLTRGFAVKDCAPFGLPECIRIGVRAAEDCRALLAALGSVIPAAAERRSRSAVGTAKQSRVMISPEDRA